MSDEPKTADEPKPESGDPTPPADIVAQDPRTRIKRHDGWGVRQVPPGETPAEKPPGE